MPIQKDFNMFDFITSQRKKNISNNSPDMNTGQAKVNSELQQISLVHFMFCFYCFNS